MNATLPLPAPDQPITFRRRRSLYTCSHEKTQPHMLPTQAAADVTAGQRCPIALIYQKSHPSGMRSVKSATAEPVRAQLPTPEHQILCGSSRQLSTNVKAAYGTGDGDGKSYYQGHLLFSAPPFNIHTQAGSPDCFAIRGWNSERSWRIVSLNTKQFNYGRPVGWQA